MTPSSLGIGCTERGWLPDALVRFGVRALLKMRLAEIHARSAARAAEVAETFVAFEAARFACVLNAARLGACRFPNSWRAIPVLVLGRGLITPMLIGFARRLEAQRLAHKSARR